MVNENPSRTNSLTSIGFPTKSIVEDDERINRTVANEDETSQTNFDSNCMEPENHSIPKDVVCFLAICEQHQCIVLQKILNDCYFFPSVQFEDDTQSWAELTRNIVAMIIQGVDPAYTLRMKLIDIYRVQMPKTHQFIQRFLFRITFVPNAELSNSSKSTAAAHPPCICMPSNIVNNIAIKENQDDIVWLSLKSIPTSLPNIWGGEIIKFFYNPNWQKVSNLNEFNMIELDSNLPKTILETNTLLQNMNESISYFASSIIYLFNEFVVQCFPSNSMGFSSFSILCDKLGWMANNELRLKVFRSLDRQSRRYITYEDLVEGLILFDSTNEMNDIVYRHGYIFRFYDCNWDNRLELEEYRQLFVDYYNANHFESVLNKLNKNRESYIKEMIENTWNNFVERNSDINMSFEQYLRAYEQINHNIGSRVSWLPAMPFFDQIFMKFNCRNFATTYRQKIVDDYLYYTRCEVCMAKKFTLSSCLINLTEIGSIYRVFRLRSNPDVSQINFVEEFLERNIFGLANEFIIRIEKIAYNIAENNEYDTAKNYFFPSRRKMIKYLHLILEHAKKLIENDPKIIEIASPAFVVGDLYGSLKDLLHLSQNVFRTFPFFNGNAVLFLGNYIDADSVFNLECLIYILCMKILAPTRVFMLRGSNELCGRAQIQLQDKDMPDEPLNDIICTLIAQIFESLPIAGVVDEQIFAAHSGIPKNIYSISRMKMICNWYKSLVATNNAEILKSKSNKVEKNDSLLISELLMEELMQLITNEPTTNENLPKEDAASLFTSREFDGFLRTNQMFCMIRSSHPDLNNGFRFNSNFNLATIVTSTKGTKVPAAVFFDHGRIRLLRFDM